MPRGPQLIRVLAVAAVVVAASVLAVVVLGIGGTGYEVTARFRDAGQLVKGGTVQVAGGTVGTIKDIRLGDDGVAEVVLGLDDEVRPLRRGTTARIRSVGLSGVANRFVSLAPGDGAPIEDGGRLELTETEGIVDLDAVLTSLDPATRKRLSGLLASGGRLGEGTAAADVNRTLTYFAPALAEGRALARELTRDREALGTLLSTASQTARVVASHDAALARGLTATATTLRAVADERGTVDSLLRRAPDASRRVGRSLDRIGLTLDRTRPALGELAAAAPALADLARRLPPAARTLTPVLADLRATLPGLDATLRATPALSVAARPAFASTVATLQRLQPIVAGLRPYAHDVVAGLFLGFGGTAGATYDANGHLARIAVNNPVGAPGIATLVTPPGGPVAAGPNVVRTGLTKRCPGAGAQRAPDGSNDAPAGTPNCDPSQARP